MTALATGSLSSLWQVFLLFSIPIGGGIPAGVILGQSCGVGWGTMIWLYLISEIVMALYFEPLLRLVLYLSKKNQFLARFREELKKVTNRSIAGFSAKPGPFMLVVISFGIDPMTGRAAAMAAGHGLVASWIFAIAGDMIFFGVTMVSTIWLHGILGDGTWTAIIIVALMIGVPAVVRKLRKDKI